VLLSLIPVILLILSRGAFNPIFRLHGARRGGDPFPPGPPGECGTSPSNEIWNFGPESEAAIARVMRIREQMRPYIMERYAEASVHGTPVMRPLFFDFWKDAGSQHIEDQLMFGPEYMLAPQLNQNGTSRAVYLPQLPSGFIWQNVFTKVETGTSAGGKTITEGTPLTGDGFGTFPLYRKVTRVTYPPHPAPSPPPPAPPTPTCNDSCQVSNFVNSSDVTSPHLYSHSNSSTVTDCCAKCKADTVCAAFVWGPYEFDKGPLSCFLFKNHGTPLKKKPGRTYGCLRAA
jgi:alpha-D-xyloside xylohydrolase